MDNTNNMDGLGQQLLHFEENALAAIQIELARIKRTVRMEELNDNPFRDDVKWYMDALKLDEDGKPAIDTCFSDTSEKTLEQSLSDNEIGHWELINLYELLTYIRS